LMREGKGASLEAQQAYNEYLRAKTAYDALSR